MQDSDYQLFADSVEKRIFTWRCIKYKQDE